MVYVRVSEYYNVADKKRTRRFYKDKNAGLEGMPLQLLIIVVIAVMALGMIMSWMSSVNEPPKTIKVINVDVDGNGEDIDLSSGTPSDIEITVYDHDLKMIEGVIITLDGCGFDSVSARTGTDDQEIGTALFDGKQVDLPAGIKTGEISVTAKKPNYTMKTTTILVYTS
jgi:hypothetical protein